MREEFETTDKNSNSGGFSEVLKILAIIISLLTFLCLLTRDMIFSSFGIAYANFILGIFGFSSYVFSAAIPVILIVSMFSKKRKGNVLMVVSLSFMLFAGLVALEVWTSGADRILGSNLTFSEFVESSYGLKSGIGFFGSTSGGALMSSIIYFPAKLLKGTGTYVFCGVIFLSATVALYASIRNMIERASRTSGSFQRAGEVYPNSQFSPEKPQPVKVKFASSIDELTYNKSEKLEGSNFFSKNLEPQAATEKPYSAYDVLYGDRAKSAPRDHGEEEPPASFNDLIELKGKKTSSGLKVFNSEGKELNQKSKKEIKQEEKLRREDAMSILFDKEDAQTDFTVSNENRTKRLDENRTSFDQRGGSSLGSKIQRNTFDQLKNDDKDDYVDLVNKPKDNVERGFIDAPQSGLNFNATKKVSSAPSSFFDVVNKKEDVSNDAPFKVSSPNPKNVKKEQSLADLYRKDIPSVTPTILSSPSGTATNSTVSTPTNEVAKEIMPPQQDPIVKRREENARRIMTSVPTPTKEEVDAIAPQVVEEPSAESNSKEEIIKSIKDKSFDTDRYGINVELLDRELVKRFEKKMPETIDEASILRSVDQLKNAPVQSERSDIFSKPILNSPIDEAFNSLNILNGIDNLTDSINWDKSEKKETIVEETNIISKNKSDIINQVDKSHPENRSREILTSVVNVPKNDGEREIISSNVVKNPGDNSRISHSVVYPLNKAKEVKTTTGTNAVQLPIFAKDTYVQKAPEKQYAFPPVDLLEPYKKDYFDESIREETEKKSRILEDILESFSIGAKVVETVIGPVVTRYELEIQQGTTVKRVEQISKDITMGLESPSEVIIQAPIPGKNRLGIEVPNKTRDIVTMRELIESEALKKKKSKSVFALGKDVSGEDIICDIANMPHLLIAGSTGMGKSVCLNTILISVLYNATPDEVRIILIDPKRVEFTMYQNLPHLLIDEIIFDNDKAISTLEWAINEMERRFRLFQESRTKDLNSYNESCSEKSKKLPRVFIIIDELADLLSTNKKEMEDKIVRLAQKARAAGLHLVLATQRPSVNVITGVIKTNLPSRISFKLTSGIDSKTVLDETGAEKLLGKGDMFYKPADFSEKLRVQGCFVSTKEVERVVNYVIENNVSRYDSTIKDAIFNPKPQGEDISMDSDYTVDDKFVDSLRLAIESKNISISMIQRRFSVGYSRAGRIIETMEKLGYISGFNGSKPREVFITEEQFEELYGEN